MKIKRFEASSMSEALRMVRKEFGEEAVILSAKNVRKSGRLFGKGAGGAVIVTAAIDRTPAARHAAEGIAQAASEGDIAALHGHRPETPMKANQGISRFWQHFTPITRTGQQKLQPKLIRLMNSAVETPDHRQPRPSDRSIYEQLREQGLSAAICAELTDKISELMPSEGSNEADALCALSQIMEAQGWVAPVNSSARGASRVIALVGAHGAGKTTTAAKLAAHAVLSTGESVALLSLDDHRIGGAAELQRYAGIMGVPFEAASDAQQARAALNRMSQAHRVIVDTPGLSLGDIDRQAALGRMLESLGDPEIHLLIHAGAREQVMARTVDYYKPLNISRMLPTHVDWCRQLGPFLNLTARHPWPIAYLGTGPQVPEDLQLLTARQLAAMMVGRPAGPESQAVEDLPGMSQSAPSGQYVANRNSDIFHDRSCKYVQRMNDDNMLIFKDSADAIDQGFIACRLCCMAHLVPKPIDRPAHPRFAGSRN